MQDNKLYSCKSNSLLLFYPKVLSTIIVLFRSLFLSILASTESTQKSSTIPPNQGRRTAGLSNDVMWTIIGSCTTVVVIAFSLF